MPKKSVAVSLRKPTPVDPDSFVAAATPSAQRFDAAEQPAIVHRAREYREMTLYLPTDVVRDLSLFCMDRNCDVNGVVAEAVRGHVAAPATELENSTPAKYDPALLLKRSGERLRGLWALRPWAV